jgi:hypothetical protein
MGNGIGFCMFSYITGNVSKHEDLKREERKILVYGDIVSIYREIRKIVFMETK